MHTGTIPINDTQLCLTGTPTDGSPNDDSWSKVKVPDNNVEKLVIRFCSCAIRVHMDRDGLGNTNGICNLRGAGGRQQVTINKQGTSATSSNLYV